MKSINQKKGYIHEDVNKDYDRLDDSVDGRHQFSKLQHM
jgi:hypothetical protein